MKQPTIELTQERLKELLRYDPDTGIFYRKISMTNRVKVGSAAGYYDSNGYLKLGIGDKEYLSHRLAWLYVYGYMPENQIDHINRLKNDNRIKNLREVSSQCNVRNSGNPANNKSGVKGVSWLKNRNIWRARITVDGKEHHLGGFNDFVEAVAHRLAAEQCFGWSLCDSATPAYRYMHGV